MTQPVILIDYEKHKVSLVGGDPTKDKLLAEYLRRQNSIAAAPGAPGRAAKHPKK